MRDYQAWLISQFLYGEHYGLLIASRLALEAPDHDIKVFAASQAADEARHMEVLGLASFAQVRQDMTSPLVKEVFTRVMADEGRRVAFGRNVLSAIYAEMAEPEMQSREQLVLRWCAAMSYRGELFRQLAGTLRDVGLWRPAIAAWFAAIGVELAPQAAHAPRPLRAVDRRRAVPPGIDHDRRGRHRAAPHRNRASRALT